MMYVLNLAEDGRVLSATYPQYAPIDAIIVDALPEGNLHEYRYSDGRYVHDPLPEPEPTPMQPTTEERLSELEAAIDMLLSGATE